MEAVVIASAIVLLIVLWMWGRGMIVVGAILLGALIGGIIGFAVGVARGPGPESGAMYGLEQVSSGIGFGFLGVFIGTVFGGASGWAFKRWRSGQWHRMPSSHPPGRHLRGS